MKLKNLVLAAFLATNAPSLIAAEVLMETPGAGSNLWFTDHFVSAFYTVNEENYQATLTFSAGPKGNKQPIQQTVQLNDGQKYQVSVGGYAESELVSTLTLTRVGDRILAEVTTAAPEELLSAR